MDDLVEKSPQREQDQDLLGLPVPSRPLGDSVISEDEANVSMNSATNEKSIKPMSEPRDYNFKGLNYRNTSSQPEDRMMLNVHKGGENRVGYDANLPLPEQTQTPRLTQERSRPASVNQNLVRSQIIDNSQQLLAEREGGQSRLMSRRNLARARRKQNGDTCSAQRSCNEGSISRQIQDLNLESKIKNLQESISNLPDRVTRGRSTASRRKDLSATRGDESSNSIIHYVSTDGPMNNSFAARSLAGERARNRLSTPQLQSERNMLREKAMDILVS